MSARVIADLGLGSAQGISINALTNQKVETDLTSYETASIAPTANRLVIAIVGSRCITGPNVTPTASGGGMTTWSQVATRIDSVYQITMLRALQATPISGILTFDFGSTTQNWCLWSVFEISNIDTSGTNGSGAIVQSNTNQATGTSLTVTLNAFGDIKNGAIGGFYCTDPGTPGSAFLPGSGFTAIHCFKLPGVDSGSGLLTEYKTTNDTSVDATFDNSDAYGVAAEIKAA